MNARQPSDTVDGLAFIGTESGLDKRSGGSRLRESVQFELRRIERRLQAAGRSLGSCLSLDAFYDKALAAPSDIESELSEALGETVKPSVLLVPMPMPPEAGRRLVLQAISSPTPIQIELPPADGKSPDSGHAHADGSSLFPDRLATGNVIFVSGRGRPGEGGIAEQSHRLMSELDAAIRACGATFAEAVKFNIYYVGSGTMEDWATAARVRSKYFDEPGPVATGIPVPWLARPGELIVMQLLAVKRRDGAGEVAHSSPEGHWDWPFHLPYRHGCLVGRTALVGGQVSLTSTAAVINPDELAVQTTRSLRNIEVVLAPFGLGLTDLLRVTAFFRNTTHADRSLVASLLRQALGEEVEVSLVGLPALAFEHMVVEIEAEARG